VGGVGHFLADIGAGKPWLVDTSRPCYNRIWNHTLYKTYHYLKPNLVGVSNSGDAHNSYFTLLYDINATCNHTRHYFETDATQPYLKPVSLLFETEPRFCGHWPLINGYLISDTESWPLATDHSSQQKDHRPRAKYGFKYSCNRTRSWGVSTKCYHAWWFNVASRVIMPLPV
jgi:hypothetical protein